MDSKEEKTKLGTRAPIEIRFMDRIIYRGLAYFNSGLRAEEKKPFIVLPMDIAEKAGIVVKGLIEAEGFTVSYLGETDAYAAR